MSTVSLERALGWLDEHINLEVTAGKVVGLSLERMRSLVRTLGDPQTDFPVIHVTGTNGKGSTSAMAAAILSEIGLTVGTYGSPHVSRIGERIQYNLAPIPDDELARVLTDLRQLEPHLDARPSWFEIMTAAAYRWFSDIAVDVAVIEVGKLGRYDATNVVDGEVAVITNIGKDHTDGGPGWREAIAWEKAGIIRPDAALCLGERDRELYPVFAAEEPLVTYLVDQDFGCTDNRLALGGRLLDLRTPHHDVDEVFVSMHGAHQGDNAAVALMAVEAFLGVPVQREVVDAALAAVSVPGRLEVLGRDPLIVVDGAHNPDGARVARAAWTEAFAVGGTKALVVGMLDERDPREMFEALGIADFDRVICCTPPSPRARQAATIAEAAVALGVTPDVVEDPARAVDRARHGLGEGDSVFVAGSMYLAGAARDHLLGG